MDTKNVITKETLVPLSVFGLVLICLAGILLWMTTVYSVGSGTSERLTAVEKKLDNEIAEMKNEMKEYRSNQIEIMKQLSKVEGLLQNNNQKK